MSQAEGRFRGLSVAAFFLLVALIGCGKPTPLTAEKAAGIVEGRRLRGEPVYAEVPQRVFWGPRSPKDDYDEKAVRTLRNLEREGLLTVTHSTEPDGTEIFQGKVTEKGFPILGTMPSARGPAFRGQIATKQYEGLRNFLRHPSDPLSARAELVWSYEDPTPLYPLFETKIDKPLHVPFATILSFYWEDHQWKVDVMVAKKRVEGG